MTGLSLDETIARMAIDSNGSKSAGNSRLYMTDALNSVISQMNDDDQASLANSYAYSPYGQSEVIGIDSTGNPIQYTSRESDGTGLIYYRARYRDPVFGGWLSEDPAGFVDGFNKTGYVQGDPINLVDPTGLWMVGVGVFPGVGAQFSFGQNPNGAGFFLIKFGWGIGGGISFEPFGKTPDYQECDGNAFGVSTSLYTEAALSGPGTGASVGYEQGRTFTTKPSRGFGGWTQAGGFATNWGAKAQASAGGQITIFGGGSAPRPCTCSSSTSVSRGVSSSNSALSSSQWTQADFLYGRQR